MLKEQEDTVGQVAIAAVGSLAPSSSATIHQTVFEDEEEDRRRRWRSQFTYTCAYEDGIVLRPTPQDDDEEEEAATPSSALPPHLLRHLLQLPCRRPHPLPNEGASASSSTSGSSADPLASYSNAVAR